MRPVYQTAGREVGISFLSVVELQCFDEIVFQLKQILVAQELCHGALILDHIELFSVFSRVHCPAFEVCDAPTDGKILERER